MNNKLQTMNILMILTIYGSFDLACTMVQLLDAILSHRMPYMVKTAYLFPPLLCHYCLGAIPHAFVTVTKNK